MQHVIIGAGPAGVVAAETLGRLEPSSGVLLLTGEAGLPYSRMALPYLIAGDVDEEGVLIRRSESHYRSRGIELREATVEGIDLASQRVSLRGGETVPYDRLLLATGSRSKLPPIPGVSAEGVTACWTLEDARRVMARARPGARVVVLGAGFIACVIMKALIAREVALTVVCGSSGRMVRSMLCAEAGALLASYCSEERGVRVIDQDAVGEIADGPVVVLASGERLEADLVILATGVEANVDLLRDAGVEVGDGVRVDEGLRTPAPNVWAAGDVAQGPAHGSGRLEVHPTHPTATEHGRVAAHGMAGRHASFQGSVRMNVLDTAGLVSTALGRWEGVEGGDLATAVDRARRRFLSLAFEDDRVVGANAVGHAEHLGALRGLIQSGVGLGPWKERLMADPSRVMEAFVARAAHR